MPCATSAVYRLDFAFRFVKVRGSVGARQVEYSGQVKNDRPTQACVVSSFVSLFVLAPGSLR